jgi:hypothetical protein
MILVIDNYDSFTYNLVQYLGELGATLEVVRNDAMSCDAITELGPERVVISPGPGTPNQAGVSLEVIRRLGPMTPDPRCVSRPPGYRPGLRSHSRASEVPDARQDLGDPPRRRRRLRGSREPLR